MQQPNKVQYFVLIFLLAMNIEMLTPTWSEEKQHLLSAHYSKNKGRHIE